MGLGGYMEYYVQRHGDRAVFSYTMMGIALVALVALGCVIRYLAERTPKAPKAVEEAVPMPVPEEVPEQMPAPSEENMEETLVLEDMDFDLEGLDLEDL